MNNLKCLSDHVSAHASADFVDACDVLNKKDIVVSVDLINACETLRKELLKSMKIAKKFKKEGVRGFGACTWSCQ